MMTEDEFYEWFAQCDVDSYAKRFYEWYEKSGKFDALVEQGVDNWSGYSDAMQALETGEDEEC